MKKLLIYGGTFDPVHMGHKNAFDAAKAAVSPDLCVIIPNAIPPHKASFGLVSGEHRMNMLKLTFGENDDIIYSDYELNREGKSYSVYTLSHFKEQYPDHDIYFIVGSDSLIYFSKWYEYERILKMCTLVCVSRQKGDRAALEEAKAFLEAKGGSIIICDVTAFEVSSSEIRKMLMNGESPSCYLEENVVKYIYENSLYQKEALN
ncbi:MAG: nicotinate (nicotinamide) nucleotide adenylyltransferase [Ruminococcus sp.]|nr:nicotinate (nicotinamide) nucleotide adenylyltransferase [Ruminococcus sp.]